MEKRHLQCPPEGSPTRNGDTDVHVSVPADVEAPAQHEREAATPRVVYHMGGDSAWHYTLEQLCAHYHPNADLRFNLNTLCAPFRNGLLTVEEPHPGRYPFMPKPPQVYRGVSTSDCGEGKDLLVRCLSASRRSCGTLQRLPTWPFRFFPFIHTTPRRPRGGREMTQGPFHGTESCGETHSALFHSTGVGTAAWV